ncbi:hypothetical protein AGDE_14163 [Angomonas deanei]|nr:hypothetical protein AGDE_14163 [Angomonas deanei]|eukprot:EPY21322.1 hypothetical protein AGDE_14163 [Angomonas deanei]
MMPLCVLLGLVVSSLFSTTYLHLKYKAFSKRVLAERRRVMEGQLEERCVEPAAEDETKPVQEPLVGVLYTEEPEEDRPRNATQ